MTAYYPARGSAERILGQAQGAAGHVHPGYVQHFLGDTQPPNPRGGDMWTRGGSVEFVFTDLLQGVEPIDDFYIYETPGGVLSMRFVLPDGAADVQALTLKLSYAVADATYSSGTPRLDLIFNSGTTLQVPLDGASDDLVLVETEIDAPADWLALAENESFLDVDYAVLPDEIAIYDLSIQLLRTGFVYSFDGAQWVLMSTGGNVIESHNQLIGRDAINAHPIEAITDLQDELDSKADAGHPHAHGTLTGLNNDDHPQYLDVVRGYTRTLADQVFVNTIGDVMTGDLDVRARVRTDDLTVRSPDAGHPALEFEDDSQNRLAEISASTDTVEFRAIDGTVMADIQPDGMYLYGRLDIKPEGVAGTLSFTAGEGAPDNSVIVNGMGLYVDVTGATGPMYYTTIPGDNTTWQSIGVSAHAHDDLYVQLDDHGSADHSGLVAQLASVTHVTSAEDPQGLGDLLHVQYPTIQPSDLGLSSDIGVSDTLARADHVHKQPTIGDIGAAAWDHSHDEFSHDHNGIYAPYAHISGNDHDARYYTKSTVNSLLGDKSDVGHAHSGADITSGTVAYDRLPVGSGSSQVAQGSHGHAYAPTSHDHAGSDITSGTVPYAHLPVGTGAAEVAQGSHGHNSLTMSGDLAVAGQTTLSGGTVSIGGGARKLRTVAEIRRELSFQQPGWIVLWLPDNNNSAMVSAEIRVFHFSYDVRLVVQAYYSSSGSAWHGEWGCSIDQRVPNTIWDDIEVTLIREADGSGRRGIAIGKTGDTFQTGRSSNNAHVTIRTGYTATDASWDDIANYDVQRDDDLSAYYVQSTKTADRVLYEDAALSMFADMHHGHGDYVPYADRGVEYPPIVDGKIPQEYIPPAPPNETYFVADETARLALTGLAIGDVAVQESDGSSWAFKGPLGGESTPANWIAQSTGSVVSVNSQTGVVVLNASDVGAPPTSRSIATGTGLSGGGTLAANRTLSINRATTDTWYSPLSHSHSDSDIGGPYLPLSGGTITGILSVQDNRILNRRNGGAVQWDYDDVVDAWRFRVGGNGPESSAPIGFFHWDDPSFLVSSDEIDTIGNPIQIGDPKDDASATSLGWALSRGGDNMVTNGNGYMRSRYNWDTGSEIVFDDVPSGAVGAFRKITPGVAATVSTQEYIAVVGTNRYELKWQVRQANATSAADPDLSSIYTGFQAFYVDGSSASPRDWAWRENTLTTLAQDLNDGDDYIYLTDNIENWYDPAGAEIHFASVVFWNYVDGLGKTWPPETYSKWWVLSAYVNVDIPNSRLVLAQPWSGGSYSAGHPLSNTQSGGSYQYNGRANYHVGSEWEEITAEIGGIGNQGRLNPPSSFTPGVVAIRMIMLVNRSRVSGYGGAGWNDETSDHRWSAWSMRQLPAEHEHDEDYLSLTGGTVAGTVVADRLDSTGIITTNGHLDVNVAGDKAFRFHRVSGNPVVQPGTLAGEGYATGRELYYDTVANRWSVEGDFKAEGSLISSAGVPLVELFDTDAPANQKRIQIRGEDGSLALKGLNDAGGVSGDMVVLNRNGSGFSNVTFADSGSVRTTIGAGDRSGIYTVDDFGAGGIVRSGNDPSNYASKPGMLWIREDDDTGSSAPVFDPADYAAVGHQHAGVYSPVGHTHAGDFATAAHSHTGEFAEVSHAHANYVAKSGDTVSGDLEVNGTLAVAGMVRTDDPPVLTPGILWIDEDDIGSDLGDPTRHNHTPDEMGLAPMSLSLQGTFVVPSGDRGVHRVNTINQATVNVNTLGAVLGSETISVPVSGWYVVHLGTSFGSSSGTTRIIALGTLDGNYNDQMVVSAHPQDGNTSGFGFGTYGSNMIYLDSTKFYTLTCRQDRGSDNTAGYRFVAVLMHPDEDEQLSAMGQYMAPRAGAGYVDQNPTYYAHIRRNTRWDGDGGAGVFITGFDAEETPTSDTITPMAWSSDGVIIPADGVYSVTGRIQLDANGAYENARIALEVTINGNKSGDGYNLSQLHRGHESNSIFHIHNMPYFFSAGDVVALHMSVYAGPATVGLNRVDLRIVGHNAGPVGTPRDEQWGIRSLSVPDLTAGAGYYEEVTFPEPFLTVPHVTVDQASLPGGAQWYRLVPYSITATGFRIYVYNLAQSTVTAKNISAAWHAVEQRPAGMEVPKGDTEWQVPALLNGYTNYGGNWEQAGYRKDDSGVVHLRGMLKPPSISGAPSVVAFELPPGYRPSQDSHQIIYASTENYVLQVMSTGEVQIRRFSTSASAQTAAYVSLAHITFIAEQ